MRIKQGKTKFDEPINMRRSISKYSATVNLQNYFFLRPDFHSFLPESIPGICMLLTSWIKI